MPLPFSPTLFSYPHTQQYGGGNALEKNKQKTNKRVDPVERAVDWTRGIFFVSGVVDSHSLGYGDRLLSFNHILDQSIQLGRFF
jgi:hypothetical protein